MIEVNELAEIWQMSLKAHKEGNYVHLHHKAHWDCILLFWDLKDKIDALKKQILLFSKHIEKHQPLKKPK